MKLRYVGYGLCILALASCQRVFDNPYDPLNSLRNSNPSNPATWTVTYTAPDAEGGSVPIDPMSYLTAQTATVLGNPGGLARSGLTLSAWRQGTTDYVPGDSLIMTSSLTLTAQWTSSAGGLTTLSASAAPNSSYFHDVAVAPDGSVYLVGSVYGTGSFTFNSKSVSGIYGLGHNALIIKRNPDGTVAWAKSVSAGGNTSVFRGVAVDSAGNAYAAGYQTGTGSFTYDTGKSASGPSTSSNAVLVKYTPSGAVEWVKTASSGGPSNSWNGVAVVGSQVVAVGEQASSATLNWGGVSTTSSSSSGAGLVVAFQTTNGTPLWGHCLGGSAYSTLERATPSPDGQKIAVIGFTGGNTSYASTDFTVPGKSVLVLQLDSSGSLLWGRTASGTAPSEGKGVAYTREGRLWITGYYTKSTGGNSFDLGSQSLSVGPASGKNTLYVAKLEPDGTVTQLVSWNNPVSASEGHDIDVDVWGNVFVAGSVQKDSFTFSGILSNPTLDYTDGDTSENFFLLKLNPLGKAEWVRGHNRTSSPNSTYFGDVAVSSEKVYVTGYTKGNLSYPLPAHPSGTLNVQGVYSLFNAALVVFQR